MAAAFALRCSEKETLLVAAGNTIAVLKYNGVIKKATTDDMTNAAILNTTSCFRRDHKKRIRLLVPSDKALRFSSIHKKQTRRYAIRADLTKKSFIY